VSGESRSTRRELLATLGGAWAVAAAGCGALSEDDEANGDDEADGDGDGTETEPDPSFIVETSQPTTVGSESGTLQGSLAEMAQLDTVDCYFEYRQEGGTWTATAGQSLSSTGEFSRELSGLAPDTDYEFRAVGEAGGATDAGEVRTFTTRPDPAVAQVETDNLRLRSEADGTDEVTVAQAKLTNEGGDNSEPIVFEVTWYDEERTEIDVTSARLETLRPEETWLAQVTPGDADSDDVASITSTTTVEGEQPTPLETFSVTESSLRTEDIQTEVTGIVENTGTETASVDAIARVFDEEGHVVADSRASMRNVSAGDTRPFSATFVGRDADRIDGTFDHGVLLDEP
jgi:hypothetical protein